MSKIPPTPWSCAHALPAIPALGATVSAINSADGKLVAIIQPGSGAAGELIALAPDLFAHLFELVTSVCRLDPDYCRDNNLPPVTQDDLAEAIADATTLILYARELGVTMPLEPQS